MTGFSTLLRSLNRFALAAGLGASVALAGPVLASAQQDGASAREHRGHRGHRGHHRGHGMRLERMAQELGLSDAQQARLREVMTQARAERRTLRELPPEDRRESMQAARANVRAQIEAILTPEQRERARALKAERRQAHGERRLARMQERLGLSDAQAAQVRAIFERSKAQRRQLRESGQGREGMRALHAQTREALRAVLTPEQAAQLESRRGRRGPRGPRR